MKPVQSQTYILEMIKYGFKGCIIIYFLVPYKTRVILKLLTVMKGVLYKS